MVRRLGWGIAGHGWVARDYVAPAIAASANGELLAVHDRDEAALRGAPVAASTSLDAFLATPGLGAVYVATPNHAHRALAEAAAAVGLHVLCEKPMATTFSDARAMVSACEAAGVTYATAFDQRFHAAHVELARRIVAGECGTVTAVRIVYACWVGDHWSADNWRVDPARAGGGALIDLAPHGLDLSAMLLGERLTEAAAFGQGRVHDYARAGAVEDGAMLIARAEGGALVQLHVAYNCPEALPRRRLEVVGTRGMFTATDTMGQTRGGTLAFTDARDGTTTEVAVPGADRSPFLAQIEAFAAAVLGERPFPYSPAHDLHTMALVQRAQAMARPRGQADGDAACR